MLLKRIRRWLGWESDSTELDLGEPFAVGKPKHPATQKPPAPAPRPADSPRSQQPHGERRPKGREPLDVLDNPKLTLDKPTNDGFDPYNTGAFNRSTSWEKIGRQRKR